MDTFNIDSSRTFGCLDEFIKSPLCIFLRD